MYQRVSISRLPHPIRDQETAHRNRQLICEVRGYCGPFINLAYYRQFPEPTWHGSGECIVCCNTCSVEEEERKQMASGQIERDVESADGDGASATEAA